MQQTVIQTSLLVHTDVVSCNFESGSHAAHAFVVCIPCNKCSQNKYSCIYVGSFVCHRHTHVQYISTTTIYNTILVLNSTLDTSYIQKPTLYSILCKCMPKVLTVVAYNNNNNHLFHWRHSVVTHFPHICLRGCEQNRKACVSCAIFVV